MNHTVDKTGWGEGPWNTEPDYLHWMDEATGLPCLIVRNSFGGNLCGYVGVSTGHPWFEREHEGVDADVHGGLTYSAHCQGHICHATDSHDVVWWLGFDCGHFNDCAPGMDAYSKSHGMDRMKGFQIYRDIDYVKRQCAQLAQQAKEAA